MLSPSFGISKDNLTGLSIVEFKDCCLAPRDCTLWSSEDPDASLLAGTIRYMHVSSANLQRRLPEVIVLKSPALTT